MAENTKIEWAHHTFNPWIGCTKVGPGCDHCYAEALATARLGVIWGNEGERRRTAPSTWKQPRRWNNRAAARGVRERVFCASLADVFDNRADPAVRAELFQLIRETPQLDWLLVTKRIGNAAAMAEAAGGMPENVWLGATIVNQEEANRDIPKLLATPASVRFLSMEPLLGPVDLRMIVLRPFGSMPTTLSSKLGDYVQPLRGNFTDSPRIDWIIVGGESGPGARPMHPDWARSLRDQCAGAGVPFLFKQWGEWRDRGGHVPIARRNFRTHIAYLDVDTGKGKPHPNRCSDETMIKMGKAAAGRLLDGVEHNGFPLIVQG
ncbi:hypothetical protein S2M10_29550 [Sphingomonas sp. S2M10]|uniref:phage Gp37/Gp68 family protein n=1 Tax=Sphingomonas sp. S2M10 TaxID=2705010 RepID=UPI0014569793|nr:phage Gp37/Gp68 family protein [Sphingomonas sp. S2M10]NLS27953.1 hypothetical protein [Sphingomonas sp. S2M10]